MSLLIHRAERADRLVDALGALLSTPLDDPFASEIVAVPTPGVERWLSQRLATRLGAGPGRQDGVCAGVDFPSLRRLVARARAGTVPNPDVPHPDVPHPDEPNPDEPDPWRPRRVVWPLLTVIDANRGVDWAAPLWSYLERGSGSPGSPAGGGRRWATARHLAELFARYAALRPDMVDAWAEGRDVDSAGRPLPDDRAWQAELWRQLRLELNRPSPTDQLRRSVAELRRSSGATDLPRRISVFGPTRLEPDQLKILTALAEYRDVHLWLTHPSPALWEALAPTAAASAYAPRSADPTEALVEHRLLAYLGRDARELQLCLAAVAPQAQDTHSPADPSRSESTDPTLLQMLQDDIAANRQPPPDGGRPWRPEDRSITFHASHGPDRQVEVLRELLVGLLADDPTLEPRDIVVMCPDIETFAPLIAAAFGLDTPENAAEHPGHRLRVRLADRSLRSLNPLLALVSQLIALAESRVEASAVLDICASAPVARQFGFSTDDLDRLHDLVGRSGVRWGLDPTHRARFGMGGFGQNTWAAGLDRLLLGITMDESGQHYLGTALPLDDVDSGDVELVGRLSECVRRIQFVVQTCQEPRTASAWVDVLKEAISLLAAVGRSDSWQLGHAYAELAGIAETVTDHDPELSLVDVSGLLSDALRGRATRANFRTGTLTMCTMLPMRSVPHRVVCLLGVDDGVFPRRRRPDGDDIIEGDDWVGDRDPRSEDRQLLLDAVLAAEEQLLVVYAGRDARTGLDTPPAVPIGALLEAVDRTATTADGSPLRTQLTVTHPLQPFDGANFQGGDRPPLSFDRAALRGVRATRGQRPMARSPFADVHLIPLAADRSVGLADLARFYNHPLKALIRERAGFYVGRDEPEPDEEIPAALQGLSRWAVGERLLQQHLHGHPLDVLAAAEWRRGALPPQALGQVVLDSIATEVTSVHQAAGTYLGLPPERHEVAVDLGSVRLSGSVGNVRGNTVLRVSFSRVAAKHRLQAWLDLLALTVAQPDRPWEAVTVGRGGSVAVGPLDSSFAALALADLVDLQGTGLTAPIPFGAKTSAEYARIRYADRPIELNRPMLDRCWSEERDEVHERFYGPQPSLAVLLAEPSIATEERGRLADPTRFGTLARRVFEPLLMAEAAR